GLGIVRVNLPDQRAQRPAEETALRGDRTARGLLHHIIGGGRDDIDVLARRPASAGTAEVVAGDARAVVIDRAQAVAAVRPRVAGQPLSLEQLAAAGPLIGVGGPCPNRPEQGDHPEDARERRGPSPPQWPVSRAPNPSAHGASLSW